MVVTDEKMCGKRVISPLPAPLEDIAGILQSDVGLYFNIENI